MDVVWNVDCYLVVYCFPHHGLSFCETTLLECIPLQFCDHLCHTLMSLVSTCDKSGTMSLYLFQVVDITLLMWVPHSISVLSNSSDVSCVCSLLDVSWTTIQVSSEEI